ncbi:MAG: hypothetical protein ACYCX3_13960 [Thermoleophilia bacterium]
MVARARTCTFIREGGLPCRATPLREEEFCFWHSPNHREEATEARRLGGLRRRKERTVAGAYDFEGVRTIEDLQRLLEIAVLDALALENSIARARALAYLVQTALKLQQVGEYEERMRALEAAVKEHGAVLVPVFDESLDAVDDFGEVA